jgi:hypothetical protein
MCNDRKILENTFSFLVKDYGLKYSYQKFKNCFGGYWSVDTHSYYNESGCFTIHILSQGGEIDFFYAKKFSTVREELCECELNYETIGCEFGQDVEEKLFYVGNQDSKFKIVAEAIKTKVAKDGEFFGIEVK